MLSMISSTLLFVSVLDVQNSFSDVASFNKFWNAQFARQFAQLFLTIHPGVEATGYILSIFFLWVLMLDKRYLNDC